MAFCARIWPAYALNSMTANGLVITKTTAAIAPVAASRPATIAAFRRNEAAGRRYSAAASSGSASSTALNFVPTASPAMAPARSHVPQPAPHAVGGSGWAPGVFASAQRTASATVAVMQNVSTPSTAAKWLS